VGCKNSTGYGSKSNRAQNVAYLQPRLRGLVEFAVANEQPPQGDVSKINQPAKK
jgi:hypothetical protein